MKQSALYTSPIQIIKRNIVPKREEGTKDISNWMLQYTIHR